DASAAVVGPHRPPTRGPAPVVESDCLGGEAAAGAAVREDDGAGQVSDCGATGLGGQRLSRAGGRPCAAKRAPVVGGGERRERERRGNEQEGAVVGHTRSVWPVIDIGSSTTAISASVSSPFSRISSRTPRPVVWASAAT